MTFRLIFEMEPPRSPDIGKAIRQIEMLGPLADAILVPDNHLGLPALSSLAIALEVQRRGYDPVVAMNARDRNPLRLRSDFLTMRAYGIEEVLLLGGDPVEGVIPGVSVREMLYEESGKGLRRGVLAVIGRRLGWKDRADFLFTRLAFGRIGARPWREAEGISQPVYCGVIALPDLAIARKVFDRIPDLDLPPGYLDAFDDDDDAGFRVAIDELDQLFRSGVDGAHLVVPSGRRRFVGMLQGWIASRESSP